MRARLAIAILATTLSAAAEAQSTAPDPLRCWWRTGAGAVATGEPFTATLTCAVREEAATRTVPDESRLAAAAIQLSPFEVLGGSHPGDLRSDSHRFFQYHYTVRIIDRDAIGRDARFPDVQINYRVHTLVNGDWVQGRNRTYVLPGRPVRVLSLVPAGEDDIRDSSEESFARVETLRFRARALRIAAGALVLLGIIVAIPAVMQNVRRTRHDAAAAAPHLSRARTIAAVRSELSRIAVERGGGWSPELVARALTALRVLAASGLDHRVAQRVVSAGEPVPYAVMTTSGLPRKKRIALSSGTTPPQLAAALDAQPPSMSTARHDALEQIRDAMHTFTRALYGAAGTLESGTLDQALDAARTAAGRVTGGRQ
jgi:hypothetical protein